MFCAWMGILLGACGGARTTERPATVHDSERERLVATVTDALNLVAAQAPMLVSAAKLAAEPANEIAEIRANLTTYLPFLPPAWGFDAVVGTRSPHVFEHSIWILLAEAQKQESEQRGIGGAVAAAWWEAVNVLRMMDRYQRGTTAEREVAERFLRGLLAESPSVLAAPTCRAAMLAPPAKLGTAGTAGRGTLQVLQVLTQETAQVLGVPAPEVKPALETFL